MKQRKITLVFDSQTTKNPQTLTINASDDAFITTINGNNEDICLVVNVPIKKQDLLDEYLYKLKKTNCTFIKDVCIPNYESILIDGDIIIVFNQ